MSKKMKILLHKIDFNYIDKHFNELLEEVYPSRKEAIKKLIIKKSADVSLMTGIILQRTLCMEYGISTDEFETQKEENGKPYIKNHEDIKFNISHSGDYIVLAYGADEVGVDIEKISEGNIKVAERFFHPSEVAYIEENDKKDEALRFCEIWTMKESYLKYTGKGMRIPLSEVVTNLLDEFIVSHNKSCYIYNINGYVLAICTDVSRDKIVLTKTDA